MEAWWNLLCDCENRTHWDRHFPYFQLKRANKQQCSHKLRLQVWNHRLRMPLMQLWTTHGEQELYELDELYNLINFMNLMNSFSLLSAFRNCGQQYVRTMITQKHTCATGFFDAFHKEKMCGLKCGLRWGWRIVFPICLGRSVLGTTPRCPCSA